MYSNRYIFIYATVMVIIVAVALATAANILRPYQEKNIEIEKMKNILKSIQIDATFDNAEELYSKYIQKDMVVDINGKIKEGTVAFNVDLKAELKKEKKDISLPVFVSTNDKGETSYIMPVRGKGLWGPIWGYIATSSDRSTVIGATFGHKGETPGLGAEIDKPKFQDQFKGEKIFDDSGKFISVRVIKGGADPADIHGVDAITGGTITSNGVDEMLLNCLSNYEAFLKSK